MQPIANLKKNKVNTVQFIVGTSESGNSRDDLVVRKILRSLGIMFRESKVIQILNIPAGIPGFIRSVYRALFRRVKVKAIYDGENNAQIVSVSNIKQALHILKKL